MSYRDAAIVALILMLGTAAVPFMLSHGYDVLCADPPRFAYDLFVFCFSTFITTFILLSGLTKYAKSKSSGDGEG